MLSNSVSGNGNCLMLSIHLPHWHKCMKLSVSLFFFFARVFLSLISADRERHSFAKFYLGPAPSDSAPSASDDKVQSPRCLEAEKQRIDEHVKMFFATRNLDQAEMDSDKLFYPHLPQAPWSTSYRFHFICISHITHEGLFHCTVPQKILKVSTKSSVSDLHSLAGTVFTQFFRPDVPNLP